MSILADPSMRAVAAKREYIEFLQEKMAEIKKLPVSADDKSALLLPWWIKYGRAIKARNKDYAEFNERWKHLLPPQEG